jgi:hypothetical protein
LCGGVSVASIDPTASLVLLAGASRNFCFSSFYHWRSSRADTARGVVIISRGPYPEPVAVERP